MSTHLLESSAQGAGYAPHYHRHKSNADYGCTPAQNPSMLSSFDSRIPSPGTSNYSNVQIVCRINAPNKGSSSIGTSSSKGVPKRPASATRILFQPTGAPLFKGKEGSSSHRSNQLKINPSRSFMSVQSTPAIRSPSLDGSRSGKRTDGFVPLRNKCKPVNGVRFPSGSPSPLGMQDQKRQLAKLVNQSNASYQSSCNGSKLGQSRSNIRTPLGVSSNGIRQEAKVSVFTTTRERSNKVIISETPIAAKIINEQLAESSHINTFLQTCNSNGYDANVFDFDNVFSEQQKQDKFYGASVKPVVQAFVEGENGTVVFFGPSQAGKTYSLHGKAGKERGVVPRAVEDILSIVKNTYELGADNLNGSSMIEDYGTDTQPILSVNGGRDKQFGIPKTILQGNSQIQVYSNGELGSKDIDGVQDRLFIKMSVYMIYCDRVYDLLSTKSGKKVKQEHYIDPQSQQVVTKFVNMTEKLVLNLEQYYVLIQDAFKERKTISVKLTDHEIRKRSHLIVSLGLVTQGADGNLRELSRLNFTELCGSEQSVSQGGQTRDTSVRQFVTKSFNGLSTQILKSALGKRTQLEEGDTGLVSCLKNTLTSKSNILLVACASPIPQSYDHSLPAVKFCARIRDTIVRKLQKQGFATSRNQLEESEQVQSARNPIMKQTRFNLEVDKQVSAQGPLSTFGRTSQHSADRQESEGQRPQSSLKKPNQRKNSRSSSPLMTLDEINSISKQLEGEVKMYDALTRESSYGNKQAVDLDEVREWSMRNLEVLNKALFSLQKKRFDDCIDKKAREDAINQLFYLKERITAIEKVAMTTSPFRSLSPKARGADAMTVNTTSAASLRHDEQRDNPFNQLQNLARSEYGAVGGEVSGCSSSARHAVKAEDPSYFSSLTKDHTAQAKEYRTFDNRETSAEDERRITRSDLSKKVPFQSRYGRELSERMDAEHRRSSADVEIDIKDHTASKVPQSARDHLLENNSSLRNFSRSGSRGRGRDNELQHRPGSPTFTSNHNIAKKQSLMTSDEYRDNNISSPIKKASLQSARDQPDLRLIQDKFLSSQRVQHIIRSTFGEQETPAALYSNAEETLSDIQRLIMLEDFDGLRRRVVQLFKERQSCDNMIQTKDIELEELREQLNVRDDTVKQIERLNDKNLDQYMKDLNETKHAKDKIETQTSLHIRNLQETIDAQTSQLEDFKHVRISEGEKFEQMTQQFELNNAIRQEAEAKAARLQEENDKLYTNYDVLKEHELNIIKDFQDKKVSDQRRLDEQILELRRQIDDKSEELTATRKQVNDLENELRKQEFETQRAHEQRTLQSDAQGIMQGKLDREHRESDLLRDKIARLENELENEKNNSRQEHTDKKLAYQEIKQLQDLIQEMEKTISRLGDDLLAAKNLTDDRQGQIQELDTQKRIFEERVALKEKEMQAYIEAKEDLVAQLTKLQDEFNILDNKHVKLRAQEFDKVDVLKVNAELEGKTKNLHIDVENLIRERNTLQDGLKESEDQRRGALEQNRELQGQLEYYRQTHEATMEKFEGKFTEFARELGELTDQNGLFKEREKKYKRIMNQLEVRNLELEERSKYAQQRNEDLNAQVEFVGRDMQKLARETGDQVQIQMKTVEQNQRRVDATDRAFTDIKSMISQFRNERNHSKERLNSHRANSGSRLSPTRDESPTSHLMASVRQGSNSPNRYDNKQVSPLRHF